jgi:hypothetical protein
MNLLFDDWQHPVNAGFVITMELDTRGEQTSAVLEDMGYPHLHFETRSDTSTP